MLLAIDPDIFVAALNDDEDCKRAIEWIYTNLSGLHFAFDKKNALLSEYLDFLATCMNKKDHLAVVLLDQLLNYNPEKKRKIDSHISSDIEYLINKRDCTTPVEPILIGMSEHVSNLGLTILLMKPPGIRQRCLHQETIKKEFCKRLKKLRVEYTSGLKIKFPALETLEKSDRSYWFEDKVRAVVREMYACPHCFLETPSIIENASGVGEVDIYCYAPTGNPRQVWIGECKLREVNEDNWITVAEIKQLAKKLPTIQEYEQTRFGVSAGAVAIKPFIASNATGMNDDAWEEADKIGATFLHTQLTKNWRQQNQWGIIKLEEFKPTHADKSGWSGKSRQTFEVK